MRKCVVSKCREIVDNAGESLHRFPLQKKLLLESWLKAVKHLDVTLSKNTYLCSRHFRPEDFEGARVKRRLKPNAVPSLYLQAATTKMQKKRRKKRLKKTNQLALARSNIALDHTYCYAKYDVPENYESIFPDGTQCEFVNPWQSRVIEACFMVPVICDLGEDV